MEKYIKIPEFKDSEENPINQIDSLQENLEINPLNKTLDCLVEVFSDDFQVDREQILLLQSKVAFFFDALVENWQKNGGKITDLKKKIELYFDSREDLPHFFNYTRPAQLNKRQPTIIESVYETMERYELMEQLEPVFEKPCKGIIVGGSLSYGPFYNVRGKTDGGDSSDIDAIFILDQDSTDSDWDSFIQCSYFSEPDKQEFIQRRNIFFELLLPRNDATLLSQKFSLNNVNYEISIHFFTEDAFNNMLIDNIKKKSKMRIKL